jgi:hypothetical protein
MKTLAILLTLSALPLAACSDDKREGKPPRPTRIVCTEAGRIVHDDFTAVDDGAMATSGFLEYTSATQEGTMRVSGTCTSYPADRPAGWRPVIQGLAR